MIKVAMIGFGGIAGAHRYAYWYYQRAGLPVRLVAAADVDPSKFTAITKINIALRGEIVDELPFNTYTDWREMLEKEQPDLVDICLPTAFHKAVAIEAMERGFHVMCEKPMADTYEDCCEMVQVAEKTGRQLMIAQCVRFQPEYEYLQQAVVDGRYGKVLAATFGRYSPFPTWNSTWRIHAGRSGGCLPELNIHDIDVIQAIFGQPQTVSCDLQSKVYPYDFADTVFSYPELDVHIKSAWYDKDYLFNACYEVEFENGVLSHERGEVRFTDRDGTVCPITVEDADGVMGEIRYMVNMLESGAENHRNPPTASAETIYALEKLYESADAGGKTLLYREML